MEAAEQVFFTAVRWGMLAFEVVGVCVLLFSGAKAVYELLTKRGNVRLELAQGIALALEFKLAGEVLRTALVREWSELGMLGAVILLRGALTLLIHWEIKNMQSEKADEESDKRRDTK